MSIYRRYNYRDSDGGVVSEHTPLVGLTIPLGVTRNVGLAVGIVVAVTAAASTTTAVEHLFEELAELSVC